jgi:hypothetical protein
MEDNFFLSKLRRTISSNEYSMNAAGAAGTTTNHRDSV